MSDEPKRRLLPPGVYRITANIAIEGELTLEQLRSLFVAEPALASAIRIQAPSAAPAAEPKEDRRQEVAERARHLVEAYREKLGEGPPTLQDTIASWLLQYGEGPLRDCIDVAAAAKLPSMARHAYLRELLKQDRNERMLNKRGDEAEADE